MREMKEGDEGGRRNESNVRDLRLWKSEEGRDVRELEYKYHDDEGM